jgi:hypothetical protein
VSPGIDHSTGVRTSPAHHEGHFAELSQFRKAKSPTAREERRSLIAYEIECRMKERLGPMEPVKDAA